MDRITVDWKRCTGCRLCAVACALSRTGTCGTARARIWPVHFTAEARYVPVVCTQCAEAWCLHACPVGAIVRDGVTATVRVVEDRCVGCRACTQACPFGAITYDPVTTKALKCDECGGQPACVPICPTGAIRFEDQNAMTGRARTRWAARLVDAG